MSFLFDASSIFEAIVRGNIKVLSGNYTVELARYELNNILWKRARLIGDVTVEDVLKLADIVKRVLKLMNIINIDCCEDDILKVAIKLGITFYDAVYVYISKAKGMTLVTEDKKLRKKIGSFVRVVSLSDISLQSRRGLHT